MSDFGKGLGAAWNWINVRETVRSLRQGLGDLKAAHERFADDAQKQNAAINERLARIEERTTGFAGTLDDKASRAASYAVMKSYSDLVTRLATLEVLLGMRGEASHIRLNATEPRRLESE